MYTVESNIQHVSRELTLSMTLMYSLNMGLPTGNSQDLSGNCWEIMRFTLELLWGGALVLDQMHPLIAANMLYLLT